MAFTVEPRLSGANGQHDQNAAIQSSNQKANPGSNTVDLRKRTAEESTALYTLFLAIFTAGLAVVAGIQVWMFFRQLGLMRQGLNDAKEAADSATIAANAASAQAAELRRAASASNIDRPYLFLRPISAEYVKGIGISIGRPLSHTALRFTYEVCNYGRTPGLMYDVCFRLDVAIVGPNGRIISYPSADEPLYNHPKPALVLEMIGSGGQIAPRIATLSSNTLFDGEIKNLPLVFGFIRYRDVTNRRYQHGFGYLCRSDGSFAHYGDAYNYDREIEKETSPRRGPAH